MNIEISRWFLWKKYQIFYYTPNIFYRKTEKHLTGIIIKRIWNEDITLNVGKDGPVPICPQPGNSCGEITSNIRPYNKKRDSKDTHEYEKK